MLRFFGGALAAMLLMAAGFFILKGRAESEDLIPPAPEPAALVTPLKPAAGTEPPAAPAKSREEKRFARADKDDDGRITRAELLEPRRKAFARLDANGNGTLSFEEWAVKTSDKFAGADADGNGALTAAEFETTKPKSRPKPRCNC
jgi:hypothetical protein